MEQLARMHELLWVKWNLQLAGLSDIPPSSLTAVDKGLPSGRSLGSEARQESSNPSWMSSVRELGSGEASKKLNVPQEKPYLDTCPSGLAREAVLTGGRGLWQRAIPTSSSQCQSIRGRHVSQPDHAFPQNKTRQDKTKQNKTKQPFIQTGRDLAQVNLWISKGEDKMIFKLILRIKLSRMKV